MKTRILFICLGNICRSPAAHAVMQHLVDTAGRTAEFHIDSCGIGAWHVGQLPDRRMRQCGQRRGYAIDHRARQFQLDDFDRFDHLFVMDADNYAEIAPRALHPDHRSKIHLLADELTRHPGVRSIPDPYYGSLSDFDHALDLIEDACAHLLARL
jgi:protein-tyrosine phosphatase